MLSIIISSYRPEQYKAVEKNIATTCGCIYEIIKIDNPRKMGSSEAYNIGASRAVYDILLFLHEDINILTHDWGNKLIRHHEIENSGIFGLAGGNYVPKAPSGWYTDKEYSVINIIQFENLEPTRQIKNFPGLSKRVLAVDGVFICVKKAIFDNYKFDENLLGYHGYDTELSLRISKRYQNYIISNIVLEHYSVGKLDKGWIEANLYIRKKLGSSFQKNCNQEVEWISFERFLNNYFKHYEVNFSSLKKTFAFFYWNINPAINFKVIKKYYSYIFYRKLYNKRIRDERNSKSTLS